MSTLFCCPVCGGPLAPAPGALRCPQGHSFDVAAQGYVNLLTADRMRTKAPGDNREMVAARRAFLEAGFYEPFSDALNRLVLAQTGPRAALLDAGCGEGYYTARLFAALQSAGRQPRLAAYDISKAAVKAAAKRCAAVEWAVAGSFAIPARAGSFDCVVNVFSPMVPGEFARVLCPGGVLLFAVPGPRHLFGLKEVLYQRPYENQRRDVAYSGFSCVQRVPVARTITVTGAQVQALFAMTPYYWKTPVAGAQRLAALNTLTTEIGFDFLVYRKTGEDQPQRKGNS